MKRRLPAAWRAVCYVVAYVFGAFLGWLAFFTFGPVDLARGLLIGASAVAGGYALHRFTRTA